MVQTASVTPFVPRLPPKSLLTRPSAILCLQATSNFVAASSSPSHLSISAAEKKAATGLAMSLPMMSNAAPCTGSKREGLVLVGSSEAECATPIDPETAAARSDKMLRCELGTGVEISDDSLSVEIGADYRIERFRLLNHPDGHGVHKHFVPFYIGEILGDNLGNLVP